MSVNVYLDGSQRNNVEQIKIAAGEELKFKQNKLWRMKNARIL